MLLQHVLCHVTLFYGMLQWQTITNTRVYATKHDLAWAGPFIDDVAPPDRKTLWFGILYLFPTVGIAGGYIFGGVIGASMGWRMPFLIQVSLFLPSLAMHQATSCLIFSQVSYMQYSACMCQLRCGKQVVLRS